jgi:hypothetical protein
LPWQGWPFGYSDETSASPTPPMPLKPLSEVQFKKASKKEAEARNRRRRRRS